MEERGTLPEILVEAGFRDGEAWRAPEFVALDRVTVSLPSMATLRPGAYETLVKILQKEGFIDARQSDASKEARDLNARPG